MSDFENIHSLSGARSSKAADWKPREALLEMLAEIDRGEVKGDFSITAVYDLKSGEIAWNISGGDALVLQGVLSRVSHLLHLESDGEEGED